MGTEVIILEENNGWYKVETEITGWVSKANIELDEFRNLFRHLRHLH